MFNINNIKNVLITGATKGLGLAIAKEYSKIGANVHITHRWGSVTDDDIYNDFKSNNLKLPIIHRSNVADKKDNFDLIKQIYNTSETIDVFVSNVSFAQIIENFMQMKKSTLDLSIQYSAWPIVSITQDIYKITGSFPKYIIGVSSGGPDSCHLGYEFAACGKAILETLARYMAVRLRNNNCRVNCIRPGFFKTDSSIATFGLDVMNAICEKEIIPLSAADVAKVCIALTSGYMDAVTGQTICVDNADGLISPSELVKSK